MPVFNEFRPRDVLRSRFLVLLIAIIVLLLVAPAVEELATSHWAGLIVRFSFMAVLMGAIYSTADARRFTVISVFLGVLWLVVTWWSDFANSADGELAGGIILFVFLCLVNSRILLKLLRLDQANFDLLCAAVVVYVLLAIGWAVSYSLIYLIDPTTFVAADGRQLTWSDFLYFSLTTLTTLGYGDITPAEPIVRVWATLEAVSGVLYTTLLVARLVAIYVPRQIKQGPDE